MRWKRRADGGCHADVLLGLGAGCAGRCDGGRGDADVLLGPGAGCAGRCDGGRGDADVLLGSGAGCAGRCDGGRGNADVLLRVWLAPRAEAATATQRRGVPRTPFGKKEKTDVECHCSERPVPAAGRARAAPRWSKSFARHRRFGDDVFWLKENAELLNILECTGLDLGPDALAPHEGFYADIERRLGFFPQYYRFFLSICLDLEDLGMPGDKGEALCRWAAREGLADAELSDLQRAEARRLMLRRGIDPLPEDAGLEDRLRLFMDRSETFAMPNKKAAYELTHIVFYLSEYGRRDPGLSAAAAKSLEFAGILAFLDQNVDLLAEICVAMRHAGIAPSSIWEDWLEQETRRFAVLSGARADTGGRVSRIPGLQLGDGRVRAAELRSGDDAGPDVLSPPRAVGRAAARGFAVHVPSG
ncbi:DUF6902 family protein [Jhaorihella thermophila]